MKFISLWFPIAFKHNVHVNLSLNYMYTCIFTISLFSLNTFSFQLGVTNVGTASAPYNNDMTYSRNGGADTSVSSLNDVLGGATTLSSGNSVVLKFTRRAIALPYLDDSVGAVLSLTYRGSLGKSPNSYYVSLIMHLLTN